MIPEGKAPIRAGTKLFSDKNGSEYRRSDFRRLFTIFVKADIDGLYFWDKDKGESFFAAVRGAFLPVRKVKCLFYEQ